MMGNNGEFVELQDELVGQGYNGDQDQTITKTMYSDVPSSSSRAKSPTYKFGEYGGKKGFGFPVAAALVAQASAFGSSFSCSAGHRRTSNYKRRKKEQ